CATSPNDDWSRASRSCGCYALPLELSARMVGRPGLEPGTLLLLEACTPMRSGHATSQLVELVRLELTTFCLPDRRAPTAPQPQNMVHPRGLAPLMNTAM